MRWWVAVLAVSAVLLAGCGGTTATPSTDGTTTAARPSPDARPGPFVEATTASELVDGLDGASPAAFLGSYGPNVTASALLSTDLRRARLLVAAAPALPSDTRLSSLSTARLRELAATADAPRFVLLGDRMGGHDFATLARAAGRDPDRYYSRDPVRVGNRTRSLPSPNGRYHRTLYARLYLDDASGLGHYRLVRESSQYAVLGGVVSEGVLYGSVRIDGLDAQTAENFSRRLRSLDRQGRAVQMGPNTLYYNATLEPSAKVFERVPGATVTGRIEGVSNAAVVVRVTMRTGPGRTFHYLRATRTDARGRFELVVPYATDDAVGPAGGGVDTNVTATGPYSVYVDVPRKLFERPRLGERIGKLFPAAARFEVSETAIYEGETVDLGTITPPGPKNSSDGSDR